MKNKFYQTFALVTLMILAIEWLLSQNNDPFTRNVPMIGTLVLAIITLLTFYFTEASILHENPNRFVRGVMGGTMIKFFACIIGAGVLMFTLKKNLHKPDLFLLMFVYLIFTVIESVFLSNISRKK